MPGLAGGAPWLADDSLTFVAAYEDGWAWSVAGAPSERHVTAMIDPQRTGILRGAAARQVYLEELAKIQPFGPLLAGATLVRGPWGADASVYSAERYSGRGFLLIGDAGSFIDPLSSFGVKKALASAWLGAIAAHTILTRPAMADEALRFFDRREHAVYDSARRHAADFARRAASATDHPFWLARASAEGGADPEDGVDTTALSRDPGVMRAFDDLRRRASVRFRTGAGARFEPRAAVRGREIVMEDHLVLPAWPDGLRYIRGVDVVSLVRLAPAHTDVGELVEVFVRAHGPLALPDVLGTLATVVAKGALEYD